MIMQYSSGQHIQWFRLVPHPSGIDTTNEGHKATGPQQRKRWWRCCTSLNPQETWHIMACSFSSLGHSGTHIFYRTYLTLHISPKKGGIIQLFFNHCAKEAVCFERCQKMTSRTVCPKNGLLGVLQPVNPVSGTEYHERVTSDMWFYVRSTFFYGQRSDASVEV